MKHIFRLLLLSILLMLSIAGSSAQTTSRAFVSIDPGGTILAKAQGFTITLQEIGTGNVLRTFTTSERQSTAALWNPDGSRFALVDGSQVIIWNDVTDVTNSYIERTYDMGLLQGIGAMAWHPDSNALVISNGGVIDLTDVTSGGRQKRFYHDGHVFQLAWHPLGQYLVSVGLDSQALIWDMNADPAERRHYIAATASSRPIPDDLPYILSASWNPDGSQLALGVGDGSVRFWDFSELDATATSPRLTISSERDERNLKTGSDSARRVAWSPDGRFVAGGGNPDTITVWDIATREVVAVYPTATVIRSLAWHPNSQQLLIADRQTGIQINTLFPLKSKPR